MSLCPFSHMVQSSIIRLPSHSGGPEDLFDELSPLNEEERLYILSFLDRPQVYPLITALHLVEEEVEDSNYLHNYRLTLRRLSDICSCMGFSSPPRKILSLLAEYMPCDLEDARSSSNTCPLESRNHTSTECTSCLLPDRS